MIPVRTSSIFKSRWMALLWAAGILWFAYDFAGSAPASQVQGNATGDGTGVPASSDNSNTAAQLF